MLILIIIMRYDRDNIYKPNLTHNSIIIFIISTIIQGHDKYKLSRWPKFQRDKSWNVSLTYLNTETEVRSLKRMLSYSNKIG